MLLPGLLAAGEHVLLLRGRAHRVAHARLDVGDDQARRRLHDGRLERERIARAHLVAELRLVDAGEEPERALVGPGNAP